jgi:ribulose-5-phosphate 4-epimerase/fuculose-1-phosphate aldolase
VNASLKPVEIAANAGPKPVEAAANGRREPMETAATPIPEPAETAANARREPMETAATAIPEPTETAADAGLNPAEPPAHASVEPVRAAANASPKPVEAATTASLKPMEAAPIAGRKAMDVEAAAAERQARIDLAACYRLAAHFGLNEGIDNHLTLLVPGHADRFLLAPFGLLWSEVRASDFMVIDFEGRVLSGRGPVEDTALFIHLPVHKLAPQARCALHTHMPYATALAMLENPRLEMAGQSAIFFHDDIAYDCDYNGFAFDQTEGERLARALGSKSVLCMRNHGVLVVGGNIPEAFQRLYFLERAAQAQVLALSTGRALRLIPEPVVRTTAAQCASGSRVGGRDRAELHFEALKRLLDRTQPDYAS